MIVLFSFYFCSFIFLAFIAPLCCDVCYFLFIIFVAKPIDIISVPSFVSLFYRLSYRHDWKFFVRCRDGGASDRWQ